ncbi:hypothetical protein LCGC14_1282170 [marine sediment metagenome]|uniref:Uncharacterized protein n=1 Tax=marine sediment metagenome TaxID=412755 RepID=A0A0F9NBF1_9ZZZZ
MAKIDRLTITFTSEEQARKFAAEGTSLGERVEVDLADNKEEVLGWFSDEGGAKCQVDTPVDIGEELGAVYLVDERRAAMRVGAEFTVERVDVPDA